VFRFWPKKQYRYRAWANLLIFVGTLCIAGAGSMARAGATAGLYFAEMIASAILLAGFLMASTLEKGAQQRRAQRQARATES
jgi:undecaprenyl pyrophosphate phosphatase UppP